MTPERYKKIRDALAQELIAARCHFEIWNQLWPETDVQARVINHNKVFFHYTREAHRKMLFIQVYKITKRDSNSINLWRLLNAALSTPSLVTRMNASSVVGVRECIEAHRDLLSRIHRERNKRVAHLDETIAPNRVSLGEVSELLDDLEALFNKLSSAHDGNHWRFFPTNISDATRLMTELSQVLS